jgi:hypothetical protein
MGISEFGDVQAHLPTTSALTAVPHRPRKRPYISSSTKTGEGDGVPDDLPSSQSVKHQTP